MCAFEALRGCARGSELTRCYAPSQTSPVTPLGAPLSKFGSGVLTSCRPICPIGGRIQYLECTGQHSVVRIDCHAVPPRVPCWLHGWPDGLHPFVARLAQHHDGGR